MATVKASNLTSAVVLGLLTFGANSAQATNYTFNDLGSFTNAYSTGYQMATGINNSGQIGGWVTTDPTTSTGQTAAIWNGSALTLQNAPVGTVTSSISAINNAGQSAGSNYLGTTIDVGWGIRWDGNTPTQLNNLGQGYKTGAVAINSSGQMAGSSWAGTRFHAVRWDGVAITDLGTLGGSGSWATGINDAGLVVGYSNTTDDAEVRAAAWNGTTATDLGSLGGFLSMANGINNAGQIVGSSYTAGDATQHATYWANVGAAPVDLGSLETDSEAAAINALGEIVGVSYFYNGGHYRRATLWEGRNITDLNRFLPADLAAVGWILAGASGINAQGVIVGYADNPTAHLQGIFTLTPSAVPVPGAIWLLGSALVGMGVIGRRKEERS